MYPARGCFRGRERPRTPLCCLRSEGMALMAFANKTEHWANLAFTLLAVIFSIFLVIVLCNEGVRIYRGWVNTKGTLVPGYGLWEKPIPSTLQKMGLKPILPNVGHKIGEELLDFSQWEILCRYYLPPKQRAWREERKSLLEHRSSAKPIFSENDLPIERYGCVPTELYYQPGMGWGIF